MNKDFGCLCVFPTRVLRHELDVILARGEAGDDGGEFGGHVADEVIGLGLGAVGGHEPEAYFGVLAGDLQPCARDFHHAAGGELLVVRPTDHVRYAIDMCLRGVEVDLLQVDLLLCALEQFALLYGDVEAMAAGFEGVVRALEDTRDAESGAEERQCHRAALFVDVDNGLFHGVDDGQDVGSSEQCAALQDSADECFLVIGAYVVDLCSIVAFGACERVLG